MKIEDFDVSQYGIPVFFFLPNDSPQSQRLGIIFRDNDGNFLPRVSYFSSIFHSLMSASPLSSFDEALKLVFRWNPACKFLSAPSELEDMQVCYAKKPGNEHFPLACFSRRNDVVVRFKPEIEEIPAREIPEGTAITRKLQWLFFFSRGYNAMYEDDVIRLKKIDPGNIT